MKEYRGPTDVHNKVTLPSAIHHAYWTRKWAAVGGQVGLDVVTSYVGDGAEIKIRVTDGKGTTHGTYRDTMAGDYFRADIQIPATARDYLVAVVELPKHRLSAETARLHLLPDVQLVNPRWSQQEAQRGDVVTLSVDVQGGYDGLPAEFVVYEYDTDGAHDLVTRLPSSVEEGLARVQWRFDYQDDIDEIPVAGETEAGYRAPEYFFRAVVAEKSVESGLLVFKDWVEVRLQTHTGKEEYVLHLPDGTQMRGPFDPEGKMRRDRLPPGRIRIGVITND